MRKLKINRWIVVFLVLLISSVFVHLYISPEKTHSANFTSASATLSNARFSYKASVATGSSGSPTVTIDSDSTDDDTNHLFPGDPICFVNAAESGCIGDTTYTVANIVNSTTFNTTGALADTLATTDFVVASQSGSLTLAFTTATEIPSDGDLYITIPALDTTNKTNDGIPDTGASTSANGFDMNAVQTTDITVTGCTDVNWTVASITVGDASNDHRILINRATSACAASTAITVTIDASPGIVNPAPLTSHTRGQADTYQISITSRDGSNNTLDQSDVTVAPVEGVLISATVDETLSFTVAGITADSGSYCGVTRDGTSPDTTATSVPWGTLSPTYSEKTHNTNHQLTVSTNSTNGYKVYAEENDQMNKDSDACDSPGNGTADETDGCIKDTTCDGTCTHVVLADWGSNPSSYPGLGYSLEDVPGAGTDAYFEWDDSSATFNAKQFADQQASESRSDSGAELMSNTSPVDGSSVYVCYRIDITATQPAGYYYNKVKYTAVPTF